VWHAQQACSAVECTICAFQVEEGVQYGILSSKAHFMFFKRGVPVDGKSIHVSKTFECTTADPTIRQLFLYMLKVSVTAERLPCCQHAETPEDNKLVLSNGSVGSFVPALQGSSIAAVVQQASSKQYFEDRDDEGGELEVPCLTSYLSLHKFDCPTHMLLPNTLPGPA